MSSPSRLQYFIHVSLTTFTFYLGTKYSLTISICSMAPFGPLVSTQWTQKEASLQCWIDTTPVCVTAFTQERVCTGEPEDASSVCTYIVLEQRGTNMPVNLTVTLVVIQALNVGTPMDGRGTINTRTHTHTYTHTRMQMHTHLCKRLIIWVLQVLRYEWGAAMVLNRGNVLYQEKYVWINEEIKMGQ